MDFLSSLCSIAYTIPYLLIIPLCICLSPLCIISSSLFDAAVELTIDIDEQTVLLILILLTVWGLSAVSIFQLIKNRTYKSIFFYEFVFFLSLMNFILIGITYSILKRTNLLEQVLAKIFTTLLMILLAEKFKIQTEEQFDANCRICLQLTFQNDCMVLSCKHCFHEKCLWDWLYVRKVCPACLRPHNS